MKIKASSVKERLHQIMEEEGLRQTDILDLCKTISVGWGISVTKSDISSYCSGRSEPQWEKAFALANALHVSEAWLMGYDVPKNAEQNSLAQTKEEISLLKKFSALNDRDKAVVKQLIDGMLKMDRD